MAVPRVKSHRQIFLVSVIKPLPPGIIRYEACGLVRISSTPMKCPPPAPEGGRPCAPVALEELPLLCWSVLLAEFYPTSYSSFFAQRPRLFEVSTGSTIGSAYGDPPKPAATAISIPTTRDPHWHPARGASRHVYGPFLPVPASQAKTWVNLPMGVYAIPGQKIFHFSGWVVSRHKEYGNTSPSSLW